MTSQPALLANAAFLERADVQALFALLTADGGAARIVGGAVRNALLDIPISDIDAATDLLPAEVIERASRAGFKTIPTGIGHGTVTVLIGKASFEVTTLREDIETDGRHAKVRFGRDFRADAARRDFTVNAMSAGLDGAVHDYFGGIEDLAARRIRFIGDAASRIREDYLRSLRFFRFHAQYGSGRLDPEGLSAVIAERGGLPGLSRERVRQEAMKLLVAKGAVESLQEMRDSGLMDWLLGSEADLARFAKLAPLDDPILGLAALAVKSRSDADRLREKLRLTNTEHARLLALGAALEAQQALPVNPERARALHYRLGGQAFTDLAALLAAASDSSADGWSVLLMMARRWKMPVFPLKGADVAALGIHPGPRIGEVLRAAEEQWIEAGFPADNARLRDILRMAAT